MTRLLAAVLVLWTQLFAIVGTGNLVLCVHDDGASAIELLGSECCRAAHAAEARRHRNGVGDTNGVLTVSDVDHCTDLPYKQDQTLRSRTTHVRSETVRECAATPVALIAWTAPTLLAPAIDAHACLRAPPRGPVPRRALPFVLRS